MSASQAVVKQWFDHIADGNAQAAFSLCTDDIAYNLKGTTPVSGTYRGLDAIFNDFFAPWSKRIDGHITLSVDEIIGDGDRIVVLSQGKSKTTLGNPYNNEYAFVFGIRDGKICEIIEYMDTVLVETAAYGKRLVSD